jgi:DNA-directed RNA polymerase
LVNLLPADTVADIYGTVAEQVKWRLVSIAQGDSPFQPVAAKVLETVKDWRKLVKRNVMTWAYSSKKFGMVDQVRVDTMVPLAEEVLRGKHEAHPYAVDGDIYTNEEEGRERGYPGRQAAKLIGSEAFAAIESTVSRPADAMRFLQGIARTLAHEGKPVVWHTPMGLPVVMRYSPKKIEQLSLYLQDRGVTIRTRINVGNFEPGIDKMKAANAISPSFVHSMDACHLHMVVNAWGGPIALVHDSFGCHAGDAARFRKIITNTFYHLYLDNDVLSNILDEAFEQIETNHHRLPALPERGSYQLNEVLNAQYAFA